MNKLLNKLVFLSLIALSCLSLKAASPTGSGIIVVPLTANVVSNVLSGQFLVTKITLIATTTNLTTAKFYDSSNTTTTIVTSAYTKYIGYATNYSTIFTNENSVVLTNSYSGWYTAPVAVSGGTNSRPIVYTIMSPGNTIVSQNVFIGTLKGLAAVSDFNGQVVVEYKSNP